MYWYLQALKKYSQFSGRARRKEYWLFGLWNVIIAFALGFIEGVMGIAPQTEQSVLGIVYGMAVLIPGLAVAVRRLHDTNRSGWWVLIGAVPFIGALVLLYFFVQDGDPGVNPYGPNPKVEAVTPQAGQFSQAPRERDNVAV